MKPDSGGDNKQVVDEQAEESPPTGLAWVREVARAWGPAILAVLLIRTYIFEPFRIPSGSMVPTLLIGDHVLVNKASYGLWVPATGVEIPFMDMAWVVPRFELWDWGDPERGDVIVFRYPRNESLNFIKRVVAIPGDRIRVQQNQVILNGEPQERTFVDRYEFVDDDCREHAAKRYVESIGSEQHELLTNLGLGGFLANMKDEITVPPGHVFVMGDNRDNSEDSRRWGFARYDQIKGKAHFVWFSWDRCSGGIGSLRTERFFENLYGGGT